MNIEIVNIAEERVPTAKGGYSKITLDYIKDGQFKNKQALMSFKNPAVYNAVKNAKAGDKFDVTVTKNGEYNEWSAIKAAVGGESSQSETAPARATGTGGKVLGSQYETREERIARQRLIVRQSSLSNAIEMLTTGAKSPPTLADVAALADALVEYVYEPAEALTDHEEGAPVL